MCSIDNPGPLLEAKDIEELEASLGAHLSDSYGRFLLDNNGGAPLPNCIDVPLFGETDVQIFFGIGRAVESSCIYWNLDTLRERLLSGLVPIACDSGGNLFCLSLRADDMGAIVYIDLNSVFGGLDAETPIYAVSPSFEDLVASLKRLS